MYGVAADAGDDDGHEGEIEEQAAKRSENDGEEEEEEKEEEEETNKKGESTNKNKSAAKRRARKRRLEEENGGRDPRRPAEGKLRQERRVRNWAKWLISGEEDLHIIFCII
jgi:hypothetical protein